ncbi:MAG: response regulator, partial [Deltaproteobacteria bacterium]|nr:response regulator [Deltaproteobacteria bacterium]
MTEQKSVVLIVDDSAPARETLTEALEAEGYELHQAGGGPEALERAAALKPDVILLDV